MKKYVYFVSVVFNHDNRQTYGMCEVTTTNEITEFSVFEKLAEKLAKKYGVNEVVILNYQLLRVEDVKEDTVITIDLSWLGKDSGIEE